MASKKAARGEPGQGRKRPRRTLLRAGDEVEVISGAAKGLRVRVLEVLRDQGKVKLSPLVRRQVDERNQEIPVRGLENYKTIRHNKQAGERGGRRIQARLVDISNVRLVAADGSKKFRREWEVRDLGGYQIKQLRRVSKTSGLVLPHPPREKR